MMILKNVLAVGLLLLFLGCVSDCPDGLECPDCPGCPEPIDCNSGHLWIETDFSCLDNETIVFRQVGNVVGFPSTAVMWCEPMDGSDG